METTSSSNFRLNSLFGSFVDAVLLRSRGTLTSTGQTEQQQRNSQEPVRRQKTSLESIFKEINGHGESFDSTSQQQRGSTSRRGSRSSPRGSSSDKHHGSQRSNKLHRMNTSLVALLEDKVLHRGPPVVPPGGGDGCSEVALDTTTMMAATSSAPPLDHWVTATIDSEHVIAMMSNHNISANLFLASGSHVAASSPPVVDVPVVAIMDRPRRAPRAAEAGASWQESSQLLESGGWEVKIKQLPGGSKAPVVPQPPTAPCQNQSPPPPTAQHLPLLEDLNIHVQEGKGEFSAWSQNTDSDKRRSQDCRRASKDSRRTSVGSRKSREGRSAASSFIARLSMEISRPSIDAALGTGAGSHQQSSPISSSGNVAQSSSSSQEGQGKGGRRGSMDAAVSNWTVGMGGSSFRGGGFVNDLPSLPEALEVACESESGKIPVLLMGAARGRADGILSKASDGSLTSSITLARQSNSGLKHLTSDAEIGGGDSIRASNGTPSLGPTSPLAELAASMQQGGAPGPYPPFRRRLVRRNVTTGALIPVTLQAHLDHHPRAHMAHMDPYNFHYQQQLAMHQQYFMGGDLKQYTTGLQQYSPALPHPVYTQPSPPPLSAVASSWLDATSSKVLLLVFCALLLCLNISVVVCFLMLK